MSRFWVRLRMKKAFSIVEMVIVVAILGILAAIVVPQFQAHTTEAKASAAKADLRVLRSAIELYAAQHGGVPPGYPGGDVGANPSMLAFVWQLCLASNESGDVAAAGTAGYNLGPYMRTFPKNPFNNDRTVRMVSNSEAFPSEPTGDSGWVYQAAAKLIRLDWPGTDTEGVPYYDY